MKHFLDLHLVPKAELRKILDKAHKMKKARSGLPKGRQDQNSPMHDNIVALIFEKPSTRTRVSFDVGVKQMGGETLLLSGADMQLGHGETISDTAKVLSRYVDLIMIRTFEETVLLELAENADVPVINGLTNESHPCQIMADLMTFEERVGNLENRHFAWFGDGNNVCNSYLHAAGQFNINFTFSGPENLRPAQSAIQYAEKHGKDITISTEAPKGDVDLVITDTWASMHDAESTKLRRHNMLRGYQVNEKLIKSLGEDVYFTHCLPAHREEEVTSTVLDADYSLAFDAAENRLHIQKAIMLWCMDKIDDE